MEVAAALGSLDHRMNSVRLQVASTTTSSMPSAWLSSTRAWQRRVSLMKKRSRTATGAVRWFSPITIRLGSKAAPKDHPCQGIHTAKQQPVGSMGFPRVFSGVWTGSGAVNRSAQGARLRHKTLRRVFSPAAPLASDGAGELSYSPADT